MKYYSIARNHDLKMFEHNPSDTSNRTHINLLSEGLILQQVYMRPEVNSDRFEISKRFEMLFPLHGNLHGDFTAATFETIARLYYTCANDIF